MKTVSIIVPVYYNEGSLIDLFHELSVLEKRLLETDISMELIFVDDGSGDRSLNTLLEIKDRREETIVIKLSRNFGALHAIKTGLQFATGDCFTFIAADLQDPPELLIQMIELWKSGEKYIVAARRGRQDPPLSKLFSAIYYFLIRLFVIRDYPSEGYDLALMDRSLLPYLLKSSKNINIPLFAYWLGFKPTVINYERQKRVYGKSRWTFWKKVKLFFDSLLGFSIVPIRFMSLTGVLVSLTSFAYGIFIIANAIMGRIDVRGFATTVTLISFLLGIIIVMLGIIGEYLWRIFDEINQRPETVIDEIY